LPVRVFIPVLPVVNPKFMKRPFLIRFTLQSTTREHFDFQYLLNYGDSLAPCPGKWVLARDAIENLIEDWCGV
jgi:hypothetical protein